MRELSFLKISESQIPIDAYRSIIEHYTYFLKFFYGNNANLSVEEGSQILKVMQNEDINYAQDTVQDFYHKLVEEGFNKKSYIDYYKPINHLYSISNIKEKYKLQDINLFFNNKETFINKQFHEKLAVYDKADIKEVTSIIGTIHLITDKDEKLKIKVIDREDGKEIVGVINTGDKEKDKKIFDDIRLKFFSKETLVSGCLYRNQITFNKKQIDISNVSEIEESNTPLNAFRGILAQ